MPAFEGLMGVIGDTEGWTGDRLVGEVTVREERLRERAVLSPGLSVMESDMWD